ncbi:phospholipid carrier-dependent glycosyltransferase [Novosphingobium mangrovi (ex Huang et al. 2023)]|uniref:Polyprenol-phosphate-mannose--protein mannosyltransferase n=1 Tax=Novosphingobium mangrovi (ex Huang et al. 2023) TaxID=2976432 RepID=A0ABT2IA43_9SPHN|nr:phospholipid carrier-dependent glycosyltransferase [Novosphingobium mangrovi (ex Huang et al. 2023)]MCT2401694.1 phospholipid carrier-dependent glycosyltransferase [Novosphingobium mangrovi (ex Huang et al. 2023)]
MPIAARNARDPLGWCLGITILFLLLVLWRISVPTRYYFDEVHYVPAALKLLDLIPANREHPMFGKELIAAAIHFLGDRPLAWRIGPALSGALGLFAFSRLIWHLSRRRAATLAATVLLATNCMWFIQSRIAMLDMFEAGLCMVGLWQFAAALRAGTTTRARVRLILCGLALGLSLAAKWSSAPALMMPGLAFLALRMRESGLLIVGRKGAGPIKGISLAEATLWLGIFPLAVYWATYLPAMFYADRPVSPFGFIAQHEYMLKLQDSVKKPHPYRSYWYQWMVNWRVIWYLFEDVDGAQRGIVMIGNPFSMLAGLAALPWALWAALFRRRHDALALLLLYAACLSMWAFNGKPVQFYYHYLLPGAFLMGLLALLLDMLWQRRDLWRWVATGSLALSIVMFAVFYPIVSGAPLPFKDAYNFWMWLPTWR